MPPASAGNMLVTVVVVRVRDYRREARQKRRRYRVERRELIRQLGGACVQCGCTRVKLLEFDHVAPRTWERVNHNQMTRLRFYQREAAAGLIELRCRSCNASKGKPESTATTPPAEWEDDW